MVVALNVVNYTLLNCMAIYLESAIGLSMHMVISLAPSVTSEHTG